MDLFEAIETRSSAGRLTAPGPDPVQLARRTPEPTPEQLRIEGEKIWRSPTVVVIGCAVRRDHPKVPEIEQVLSVGAAAENLFLAAHALGFGVMWKTGWPAYDDEVKAAVGLQPQDHIVGVMHLGTRVP